MRPYITAMKKILHNHVKLYTRLNKACPYFLSASCTDLTGTIGNSLYLLSLYSLQRCYITTTPRGQKESRSMRTVGYI